MALDTEPLNADLDIIQEEFSGAIKNRFCSGAFWKPIMANEKVMKIDRVFLTEEKWICRRSAQSTVTSSPVCCAASFMLMGRDARSFWCFSFQLERSCAFLSLASNNNLARLVKANDKVNKSFFFFLWSFPAFKEGKKQSSVSAWISPCLCEMQFDFCAWN